MAPAIMGNPDRPELGEELTNSFCRTDPEIAKAFARVTFISDNRADLPTVPARTLVLQCSDDIIAPSQVGEYVQRSMPNSNWSTSRRRGIAPILPRRARSSKRSTHLSDDTEDYEDLYENAPCGYLSLRSNGSHFQKQPDIHPVDRLRAGKARREEVSRSAQCRGKHLLRDAFRAAIADAGALQRGRARIRESRRQPPAGSRQCSRTPGRKRKTAFHPADGVQRQRSPAL